MSLKLEWVLECCVCKTQVREKAETLDLLFDSKKIEVKHPHFEDWETDGLGGWMCRKCYEEWRKKQ